MMSPMSPGHVSCTYNLKKDKDIEDIGDVSSPPIEHVLGFQGDCSESVGGDGFSGLVFGAGN